MLNKILTIDPGWNTGIAYWIGTLEPLTQIIREPLKVKQTKLEAKRLKFMFIRFNKFLDVWPDIKKVYIEGTQLWVSSIKSMASVQRGNLFSLAYLVGGYSAICVARNIEVEIIYPSGKITATRKIWKGQLNSLQLARRIQRINGKAYPEHIREAVGIGFSVMNIL
jgi:hypothetical protein